MFGMPARAVAGSVRPLPDRQLFLNDPEAFWKRIRDEQFLLPGWRSFLNNGSLGVAPRAVVAAVADYLDRSAALQIESGYPRWGYETLEEHRAALAEAFGCKKEELALTHNATEGMCIVANGLDLKAGDEILMTDQEHTGGKGVWKMRAARHGLAVREIPIPLPPKNAEQLVDLMVSAMGSRTRVVMFSGITTTTGLVMPIRQICEAARAKGIISVVDGAHMHGQIPFRYSELGCDFMTGSPHKWLFAPAGSGVLYIREEMLERLWPTFTNDSWSDKPLKAARFMMLGTNNRSIFEGLLAGLNFYKSLGPQLIFGRTHQLARMAYERARQEPSLKLLTPDDDRMFGALVTYQMKKEHFSRLEAECAKRKIWIYGSDRQRVATHVHTRPADLDVYFELLKKTA
jgi:selenocysteine lyase/cysteine desulfurase